MKNNQIRKDQDLLNPNASMPNLMEEISKDIRRNLLVSRVDPSCDKREAKNGSFESPKLKSDLTRPTSKSLANLHTPRKLAGRALSNPNCSANDSPAVKFQASHTSESP